jgi:hypothetical protein
MRMMPAISVHRLRTDRLALPVVVITAALYHGSPR